MNIELLSPARDLQTGKEAILHGADAVYIGAPRFGARAAAGNSVDDIRQLVDFAHLYGVRVYVTLNTILYDDELADARVLALELQEIGVDALIVQDFALLGMGLSIPLHASTQMDNRTADKVRWLYKQGFEQAVLARELTLEEMADIHRKVPEMALEAFVHGATCVSYNGQCYASQYCFERSANRGECAQFCRLPFDLLDEEGRVVESQRHLLSLHDMNRSQDLEAMLDAGVVSLKIEGRLKDTPYVKNVTAYYRQRLDDIIRRRPQDYQRASVGVSRCTFAPNLSRSFNRGFSDYFLHGRTPDMVQLATPKSMGEMVGHVKEVRRGCFTVSGIASFSNGDGLCYIDEQGVLQGFRVNRVDGNCLYPKEMPRRLRPRQVLYRNYDQDFEQQLSRPTATRKIGVYWTLKREDEVFRLTMVCEDGVEVSETFTCQLQPARSPQHDGVCRQLDRLGDTCYEMRSVELNIPYDEASDCFIPASVLATWRREVTILMDQARLARHRELLAVQRRKPQSLEGQKDTLEETLVQRDTLGSKDASANVSQDSVSSAIPMLLAYAGKLSAPGHLTYLANVANAEARHFFLSQGATEVDDALEVDGRSARVLMTTRYCVRYELGLCPKHHGVKGQLFSLRSSDGRVFSLHFDCKNCQMTVNV